MNLHGSDADVELVGNALVGMALEHQTHDIALALGELGQALLNLHARTLADVAAFLGHDADSARYAALADATAAVHNAAYLNASTGTYAQGQQCHQVMALAMAGLVPDAVRPMVEAALLQRVASDNSSLTVGFVSFMHAVLALAGRKSGRGEGGRFT